MKNTPFMNHDNFILSPISAILKDVVSASAGVGNGIETFPLCDYVMQSVFLKMTGAQEQKMKCICWELATNDYEYRYYKFTQSKLGECSNYKDKKDIYKDLVTQIKKHSSSFSLPTSIDKVAILSNTTSAIENIFLDSNLLIWAQKSFNEYQAILKEVKPMHFANDDNSLFTVTKSGISLKSIYEEHLYKRRNKIAHNTQSYQQNLPTLKTLINEKYKYENYFVYFATLILIDNIFIVLYKEYLQTLQDI